MNSLVALIALLTPAAIAQEYRLPGDAAARSAERAGGDPVIQGCRIDLVDDVKLPANDAGVLLHLGVKEGDQVQSEAVIARIDDREPNQEKRRASFAFNRAFKQARSEISVNFAKAQYDVAVATLDELIETNQRLDKAVPEADIRQARLEVRSGQLRIENAQHDLDLAELDAYTARVELETADMLIERRVIRAPFDGEVQELYRQQQEWVSPGDPILRLIRLDTLNVEGLVNVDRYSLAQLKGCEVTVGVKVSGGRPVQATGRVTWVDPLLMQSVDGKVAKVRAEISNRRESGEWIIQPNRSATMEIHLGTGGVAAARR